MCEKRRNLVKACISRSLPSTNPGSVGARLEVSFQKKTLSVVMNPQGSRKHPIHKQDFLSRLAYPNVGKTRFSIPFKAQCWQGCGFYVGDK